MKDNIPPEEKLLRLIRGQKQQSKVTAALPAAELSVSTAVKAAASYPKVTLAQWQALTNVVKKRFLFLNNKKIIWLSLIACGLYLIASLVYPWVGLEKIKLPQIAHNKDNLLRRTLKQNIKPYEFYLKGIEGRQIFVSHSTQEAPTSTIAQAGTDLMKDLSVVGIISGESPQAIIEDKKTQKTYYVNKGQFIGQVQIADILEGKIIVNYQGQKFELYL